MRRIVSRDKNWRKSADIEEKRRTFFFSEKLWTDQVNEMDLWRCVCMLMSAKVLNNFFYATNATTFE